VFFLFTSKHISGHSLVYGRTHSFQIHFSSQGSIFLSRYVHNEISEITISGISNFRISIHYYNTKYSTDILVNSFAA
jgi:hypothetical protein